jgi:hypothetical protein
MAKSEKAAQSEPKETAAFADAFAWSRLRASALDAAHDGQWSNFLDVFTWVLNGWAVRDAGDESGAWILTDKGRALTETDFDAGLARALAVTF